MDRRTEHFPLFDSLRGLAALSVLVYHALYQPAAYEGVGRWWWRYASHLDVAVPVFLAISGFLLYHPFAAARARGRPLPSLRRYGVRRALRVVPAYWVALTVVVLWFDMREVQSWEGVVRFYGFLQIYDPDTAIAGIGQAWTLGVEVVFYALLAAFVWAVGRSRRPEWWPVAALIAVSLAWKAFMLTQADPASPRDFTWVLAPPTWLDMFAIGMLLAVLSARDPGWGWLRRPWLTWGGAAALWLGACWVAGPSGAPEDPVTDGAYFARHLFYAGFAFLLLAPAIFGDPREGPARRLLGWKPLAFVGMISFSFYLMHFAVIGQQARWWDRAPVGGAEWALWVLGALAGSVAVGTIGYFAVERPFMRLGRIGRRTAQAHAAP